MKTNLIYLLTGLVLLLSCKKGDEDKTPDTPDSLLQSFKAQEVKEGTVVVFQLGGSGNIIPGYANYRLRFSKNTLGGNEVKLTEYSGETFEGTWVYDAAGSKLTLTNLSPRPAAGDMVFDVEKLEANSLVLLNTAPNPKTGETINRYMLIPE